MSAHYPVLDQKLHGPARFAPLQPALLVLVLFLALAVPGAHADPQVFDCSAQSAVSQAECEALVDLYNSTGGGTTWSDYGGWLVDNDVCTWYGVTCDGTSVQLLELNGNGLDTPPGGGLPASLANLSSALLLDLGDNQIEGQIPEELGTMTALEALALGGNKLEGEIPSALGSLANLTTLDLGDNRLSGAIPGAIGDLSSLKVLFLERNQLEGAVPGKVCDLALFSGDLSYNKFDVYTTPAACDSSFGSWQDTQTVPPSGIVVESINLNHDVPSGITSADVKLTWTAIAYTADAGGYQVYARQKGTPPDQAGFLAATGNKAANEITVQVADDPANYIFFMRTLTDSGNHNQNQLLSERSEDKTVEGVAVQLVEVSGSAPVLILPLLAPLALLLLVTGAAFVLKKR